MRFMRALATPLTAILLILGGSAAAQSPQTPPLTRVGDYLVGSVPLGDAPSSVDAAANAGAEPSAAANANTALDWSTLIESSAVFAAMLSAIGALLTAAITYTGMRKQIRADDRRANQHQHRVTRAFLRTLRRKAQRLQDQARERRLRLKKFTPMPLGAILNPKIDRIVLAVASAETPYPAIFDEWREVGALSDDLEQCLFDTYDQIRNLNSLASRFVHERSSDLHVDHIIDALDRVIETGTELERLARDGEARQSQPGTSVAGTKAS